MKSSAEPGVKLTPRPLWVLLAKDQAHLRERVARRLEADGVLVDCVADGEAVLSRVIEERFRPDVVVSDAKMPGKTGMEVLHALRAAGLTIPIVLVTGVTHPLDRRKVEACGGAVLVEPFDFAGLRAAIRDLTPSVAQLHCR